MVDKRLKFMRQVVDEGILEITEALLSHNDHQGAGG